jgi:hypothetical protein
VSSLACRSAYPLASRGSAKLQHQHLWKNYGYIAKIRDDKWFRNELIAVSSHYFHFVCPSRCIDIRCPLIEERFVWFLSRNVRRTVKTESLPIYCLDYLSHMKIRRKISLISDCRAISPVIRMGHI